MHHYQELFERWVARLQQEEPRAVAILCHGSYARGAAEPFSDLDLDVLIDGEPEVGYRSAFELLPDGRLLHATIATMNLDEWVAQFTEPAESEEWAFFLAARQTAHLLWATPEAAAVLEGRITLEPIEFGFRGKSGIRHPIDLRDKKLAKIVQRCRDLPGQHLFQYLDAEDQRQSITSSDVNAYLRDISVWAANLLRDVPPAANQRELKQQLTCVVQEIAMRLGNTPAIARRCYIHPALIEAHLAGSLRDQFAALPDKAPIAGLAPEEAALIRFLQAREGAN